MFYPAGLSTDQTLRFVANRVFVCRSVLGESLGAGPSALSPRSGATVERRSTARRDSVESHATSNGQAQRETLRRAGVVQPASNPTEGGSPSCWPTSVRCEHLNEAGNQKSAALARADGQRVDSRPKPEASGASGHPPTLSEDGLRRRASDSASPGRGEPAPIWARSRFDRAGETDRTVQAALDCLERRANHTSQRQRRLRPGCGLSDVRARGVRVTRERKHTNWAAEDRRSAVETLTVVEAPHPRAPEAVGCLESDYARERLSFSNVRDRGANPRASTKRKGGANAPETVSVQNGKHGTAPAAAGLTRHELETSKKLRKSSTVNRTYEARRGAHALKRCANQRGPGAVGESTPAATFAPEAL